MNEFSHLDESGRKIRMVDVSHKRPTRRSAWAEGHVRMPAQVQERLKSEGSPKGPILETARLAGIQAAKRCSEWIPLCHPLPLDHIDIQFEWIPQGLRVEAFVTAESRTGVEMEALTAVAAACLTVYDMCKAVDRTLVIHGIRLLRKEGGRSGVVEIDRPRLILPRDEAPR